MKGDFTRGHNPDRKRGKDYRRVLLQQGRLLLDSDLDALVDAQDALHRRTNRDLGCRNGSPDLGFLVTPGPLLALFRDIDGIETDGDISISRDYGPKYLDRYPSLRLHCPATGGRGSVAIPLRLPVADGEGICLWMRTETDGDLNIQDVVVTLNPPDPGHRFRRLSGDFGPVPASERLRIALEAGQTVWIGLIEGDRVAGTMPLLSIAAGGFLADGLALERPGDGDYDGLDMELATPPRDGLQLVAYLEARERLFTALEDPGIREQALGPDQDTCVRTQALGRVKLVSAESLTTEQVLAAFADPIGADGTLEVGPAVSGSAPDPCALPPRTGYNGPDNRLYRFEVHRGGGLAAVQIKWSRNNGSDLYPVIATGAHPSGDTSRLSLARNTPLRVGDLVEVVSDAVDLGDQSAGTLDAGDFIPAVPRVGRLARLAAAPGSEPAASEGGVAFDLTEPDSDDPVVLSLADYGLALTDYASGTGLRLRHWHGLIERPAASAADPYSAPLERGLQVTLRGTFRVGDWWQYEARAAATNDNGPWRSEPHGPERLFAPLALLTYLGAEEPLRLDNWLDQRFAPLCGLGADDIRFDGERLGEDAVTVQEVIEDLMTRNDGDCCVHVLRPSGDGDDAAQLREILDEASSGERVHICLQPGVYRFASSLNVDGRALVLQGCPDAVITADDQIPLVLDDGAAVELADLTLFLPHDSTAAALIQIDNDARSLRADRVGLILTAAEKERAAIRVQEATPVELELGVLELGFDVDGSSSGSELPRVHLDASVVVAPWVLSGLELASLRLTDCACLCWTGGVCCQSIGALDLAGNLIVTGLDPTLASSWSAEHLAADADALIDDLAATEPTDGGQPALLAGDVAAGRIDHNRIRAVIGLAVAVLRDARLSGNQYRVEGGAILLPAAHRVRIDGEQIEVLCDLNAFGIDLVAYLEQVVVAGCVIRGSQDGILLGTDLHGMSDGLGSGFSIAGLGIEGNDIEAALTALQLGPVDDDDLPGTLAGIRIAGNRLRSVDLALLLHGPEPASYSFPQVSVVHNAIVSPLGIKITGSGFEVQSNRVVLSADGASGATARTGVHAIDSEDLVLLGNLLEAPGSATATGLRLVGGARARVADNRFRLSGTGGTGLVASDLEGLTFQDNDLQGGGCQVQGSERLRLCGNRVDGPIEIEDCDSGEVCDNHVTGSIEVGACAGDWQVQGNRASGSIRVWPKLETSSEAPAPADDYEGALGRMYAYAEVGGWYEASEGTVEPEPGAELPNPKDFLWTTERPSAADSIPIRIFDGSSMSVTDRYVREGSSVEHVMWVVAHIGARAEQMPFGPEDF